MIVRFGVEICVWQPRPRVFRPSRCRIGYICSRDARFQLAEGSDANLAVQWPLSKSSVCPFQFLVVLYLLSLWTTSPSNSQHKEFKGNLTSNRISHWGKGPFYHLLPTSPMGTVWDGKLIQWTIYFYRSSGVVLSLLSNQSILLLGVLVGKHHALRNMNSINENAMGPFQVCLADYLSSPMTAPIQYVPIL